jgi:hypothetical protein
MASYPRCKELDKDRLAGGDRVKVVGSETGHFVGRSGAQKGGNCQELVHFHHLLYIVGWLDWRTIRNFLRVRHNDCFYGTCAVSKGERCVTQKIDADRQGSLLSIAKKKGLSTWHRRGRPVGNYSAKPSRAWLHANSTRPVNEKQNDHDIELRSKSSILEKSPNEWSYSSLATKKHLLPGLSMVPKVRALWFSFVFRKLDRPIKRGQG